MMARWSISKSTLYFRVLITILFFFIFSFISIYIDLYALIFAAPIISGFIIGHYVKGRGFDKGKAGFIGVIIGMLIVILLIAVPILMSNPWFIESSRSTWIPLTITIVLFSSIIFGALGYLGGFASGVIIKPKREGVKKIYCKHCDTTIPKGSEYCNKCGKKQ